MSVISGDIVEVEGEFWKVSSVFDTNTEGHMVHIKSMAEPTQRRSVLVSSCRKVELPGHTAPDPGKEK